MPCLGEAGVAPGLGPAVQQVQQKERVRKGLKQGRHSCMRGMHSHLQLGREVDIYLHTKKESKTFLCRNCQIVIEDKPW